MSLIRPELCARCKGRLWCGLARCPLLEARKRTRGLRLDKEMAGYSPPSLLIGWRGYPDVNVTPILSQEQSDLLENPPLWVERGLSIDDILDIRLSMGGGSKKVNVRDRLLETLQELAMSRAVTAVDVVFSKEPRPTTSFSNLFPPVGFKGPLERLDLAENPRTDRMVEKLANDEVKAREAVLLLYRKGRDVYDIARYFSAGLLGREKKLVPTRWSITAADSILSEYLLRKVRELPTTDRVLFFYSHLYDNHFFIFVLPGPWALELVEAWAPHSFWSRGTFVVLVDREVGRARKDYAENVGGSFYAVRLAVLEGLARLGLSGSVLVLREVREGYYAPLGVWQVRENVRRAFASRPLAFSNLREAIEHARALMRVPLEVWEKHSVLLKGRQKTLF